MAGLAQRIKGTHHARIQRAVNKREREESRVDFNKKWYENKKEK